MTVAIWPLVAQAADGPTVAAYGPMLGGFVTNPLTAVDQNTPVAEPLYVDIDGPAGTQAFGSSVALAPGDTFQFPDSFSGQVSVNAATPGHRFAGAVIQPAADFVASGAAFPPAGQTSLLSALPQYLYQQYADDEDLAAFVSAFNAIVQEYMDLYNGLELPVYTNLSGSLLDWVALGLYGLERPTLPFGHSNQIGPLNTWAMNTVPLNTMFTQAPPSFFVTDDDVFKRVMTWYLYKGDGKQFNIRWVKRRVERFLTGVSGGSGFTDQTYDVGVTFGVEGQININLQATTRRATGGAIMNFAPLNGFVLNDLQTVSESLPVSPLVPIFKAAVDSGVLAFPFQLHPVVNVN